MEISKEIKLNFKRLKLFGIFKLINKLFPKNLSMILAILIIAIIIFLFRNFFDFTKTEIFCI